MKLKLSASVAVLLLAPSCFAHRLDEYLQAAIVSIQKDRISVSMRLIPGVAVSDAIVASVDSNHDGRFSASEQETYGQRVLSDLHIRVDGQQLQPHLRVVSFPEPDDIRRGIGEIHVEFTASLPDTASHHGLSIWNSHQPRRSVYLMNCLEPEDNSVRILNQQRNANQSYYRIEYQLSSPHQTVWTDRITRRLTVFSGVPEMFRLGMRHIAEGADHLLFLFALLVPAPLLAMHSRWSGTANVRRTLVHILRIVSAFTIGHSLTLALGASGIVTVPESPIEVLIAVSILISAAHAARPIFPGREPLIAGFFGLIHGLAFAASLHNLGVGTVQRAASLLGFNAGIEVMQLIVVFAVLPSLMLLSQTSAYPVFRLTAAVLTGVAALGWTFERVSARNLHVAALVGHLGRSAPLAAIMLLALSFAIWFKQRKSPFVVQ